MGGELKPVLPASLEFALIRETLVLCTRGRLNPGDWDTWLRRLAIPDFTKLLIFVEHGGPNASQRRKVAEYWKESGRSHPRTAVLASSPVARSLITAFQWLLGDADLKSYSPDEMEVALRWLGSSATVDEVTRFVFQLTNEKPASPSESRTNA